ncbi:unnamed protein product [Gongylonema pulchrum]|uniref:Uncharacterized protein n=1 Tax=Gongylonema pulchrum TaxID=637853 RepID=A0A183CX90_9BILA|nr:unnamed protein product [Gongylonema pulchrum]
MISERTSLRYSPNGEVEPWIINDATSTIFISPAVLRNCSLHRSICFSSAELKLEDKLNQIKVNLESVDSFPSQCALLNQKRSSLLGQCIVLILVLAVFLIGVLLAFLIGHWSAKSRKSAEHLVG